MKRSTQIFIVDDDDGHAYLVESALHQMGILNEVVRFHNGFEVIDYLCATGASVRAPVLMLLDLNMPGMDGVRVLQRLRGRSSKETFPVVVITSTPNPPEADQCRRLGCESILTKPLNPEQFVKAIRPLGLGLQLVSNVGEGMANSLYQE